MADPLTQGTTGKPGPKERIMQEILESKTLYDAEFARIQQTFGPMLQSLDAGRPPRTILFVDPLKLASAQAYGIDPVDFLQYQLKQKHLTANSFVLRTAFNNASSGSMGPFFYAVGTNPMSIPVTDDFHRNAADIVIPKSHLTELTLNIPGLTRAQLTSYVNYHEFFHCLHDRYTGALAPGNVHQKREMFADVGAMMEMIRQGEDPKIIDKAIAWRNRQSDAEHATVPALQLLKTAIQYYGVDKLRKLTDRQVIEMDYAITDTTASPNWLYNIQEIWGSLPSLPSSPSSRFALSPDSLPKGWNPTHILEDKAFELGRKVTPHTLMLANNALQAEYAAARDKDPNAKSWPSMMTLMEDTYVKRVARTDYDKINAQRGGQLNPDDRAEINQVKQIKTLPFVPVYGPKGFSS